MSETEKITINLGAVDLGQIDLLVEQSFYTNRTDLIRTAIRNQINSHSNEIKQIINQKSMTVGIEILTKETLTSLQIQNRKSNLKVVGMLIVESDVSLELFLDVIESVKVFGILKANLEIKKHLGR